MKKAISITLVTVLLLSALILVIYLSSTSQSILSASSVNVGSDGKVYWVFTASANKPYENYQFYSQPPAYTKSDGSTVTPKNGVSIGVQRSDGACVYQATKISRFIGSDYYIFSNPQKVVNVSFTDGRGNLKTIDGTGVSSTQFTDSDGKGVVTIETQGLLSGKYNCPSPNDVAMIKQKDGTLKFYYRSDLQNANSFDLAKLLIQTIVGYPINSQFTSTFTSTPTFNGNDLTGTTSIGNVVFTITADQDYFNSAVFIPSKEADPRIDRLNVPNEIKQDGSSSMTVQISNRGDKGKISITTESSTFSISPSSTNADLDKSYTASFTLKAPNVVKSGDIKVTVCSVSQFNSPKCDSKTETVNVVSGGVSQFCGDNICQSNENFNTCQVDCPSLPATNQNYECPFGQEYRQEGSKFLGIFPGKPAGCYTASWVYFLITIIIILLIIGGFIGYKKITN